MRQPEQTTPPAFKVIGTRPIRHDGEDKVTGRAQYGADLQFRDLLHGKVLRSPHAHARIVSIDVSKAMKLPGVHAVVTNKDFPKLEERLIDTGEGVENMKYMTERVLAGEKVVFKGQPIVAVAATDPWTAEEACKLVEVKYELLTPVTDVLEAMKPSAPALQGEITVETLGKKEKKATNVCRHTQNKRGDLEKGFADADVVIEREFKTRTVHQGYIEPQNATALWRNDGQITIWVSTQGQFPVREQVATMLQLPLGRVKVVPMEIGGGFGGKIPVYLEPLAALLSKKSGKPVKMIMSRAEVFQATGPASATATRIKIGVKKDGKITAASAWLAYEAGGFPNNWSVPATMCVFAPYKLENLQIDAFDVLTNTTKVAAYRAPSSPQALFGVESVLDEIALQLKMDPLELRMLNAVQEGDFRADGPKFAKIGLKETIQAALNSAHYKSSAPKGPYRARGVATGFWHNAGLQSSASVGINMDGTANVTTGSVDIGGSRASMAMMAAETLGLTAEEVRPSVADTDSIGHTDVTGGSRVTFCTGYAVHEACQAVLTQLKKRVSVLWEVPEDKIVWHDGAFHHEGNGKKPMGVKDLGPLLTKTGGPVMGSASVAPRGVGAGFGIHIADIEVDPETGKVTILRYTSVQDVGRAIHPSYVEGQIQGGTMQGIGWALNEEYMFNDKGEMMNAGFLDYRMPTMLDAPNVEVILVEVPNPSHPYGVRGVGETPIVPPIGALHNAIARAIGVRIRELPMSPPRVQAAITAAKPIAAPAR
jgi:CO/xanthine dehydrogenase Mo-binding subunit